MPDSSAAYRQRFSSAGEVPVSVRKDPPQDKMNAVFAKEAGHGYSVLDRDGVDRRAAGKIPHAGKDPGGLIVTVLIGVAGAFVGGYVGSFLGLGTVTGFNLGSILLATGGAILLLLLYRFIKK